MYKINNRDLLYYTGNDTQYLSITNNVKHSEKIIYIYHNSVNIYIYYLSHVAMRKQGKEKLEHLLAFLVNSRV